MPRTPLVRLLSTGPGPSMGGSVEKWIWRLLDDVNRNPAHEGHEMLSAIAAGRTISITPESTIRAWDWITIKNLQLFDRAGCTISVAALSGSDGLSHFTRVD
jgi:hypothetical protein